MAKMSLFGSLLGLILCVTACDETLDYVKGQQIRGEGTVQKEERALSGFKYVVSDVSADIFVKQAPAFKVVIEGQPNIIALLNTSVSGEQLQIGFKPNTSISYNQPLKIYVEAPDFQGFILSGSGLIQADSSLKGGQLKLMIDGSGDIILSNCNYTAIKGSIAGSGSLKLLGEAKEAEMDISGSGDVLASDLKVQRFRGRIEGSGGIRCFATDSLDAWISGSGDILYKGQPAAVSSKVEGSGNISPLK